MKYLLSLFLSLIAVAATQEPKRIMRTFSAENSIIIREIGAVVVEKNNKLVVEVILGNNAQQPSEVQKDDEVLMVNGKKTKTVKELREQYEHAKTGEEFKLGLKRGENLFMAKFTKKSNEELNKAGGTMKLRMEKKEGEEILPALGLGVETKNSAVVVSKVLPGAEKNFATFMPKVGDVVLSINGKTVSTAEEFVTAYDALKEGDSVTLIFSRGKQEGKAVFNKPRPMRRIMIN